MLKQLFSLHKLPRALERGDLTLLLKAIRSGEPLDQPCRLPTQPTSAEPRLPLEHALALGHVELLQKLLEAGAALPQPQTAADNLLIHAIQAPQHALAMTTALLQAGADPNADQGQALFTCLTLADDNRVALLLNRLQQFGADLNRHQRDGYTLLARLLLQQRQMLVGTLISAGAELPSQLDQLDCPEPLKQFAQRKAEDRAIARQFLT